MTTDHARVLTLPMPRAERRRAVRGRKPATYASIANLAAWMRQQPPITEVIVIRTSDKDKAGFAVMFKAGIAMLPSNADVQVLAAIGPEIVTDAGAQARAELGAYELRRGSVPGGKGYALLGYAFVIGTTLFILYLETARSADIAGETKDQTRNAFTEALCVLLRHFRPAVCYTPLVSRIFRNMDFAGQVLRTLRELKIRLVAEGTEIPLGGGDNDLMAMLKAWFAAREADGLVSRLGNIEIGMYLDQAWYLGEGFLPFTWRAKSTTEMNVLTGETVRIVENKHELEAIEAAGPILRDFLEKASEPDQTRHQLGILLGAAGVVSRAPKHFGKSIRLDSAPSTSLAANGASTLLKERWLTAWETGFYRRTIRLKSDPRTAMPDLADRVLDVDGELFLEVETPMPAPVGGWRAEALCQAVRSRLAADAASPKSTGKRSKSGQQKPLNSLCDFDLDGINYALISIDSKRTYELRSRPFADAYDTSGAKLGWLKTDTWLCTIPAGALHHSVAQAITVAIRDLEGLSAPLIVRRPPVSSTRSDPLADDLVKTQAEHAGLDARLEGIKADRQRLEGLSSTQELTANQAEQLAELPADEDRTRDSRRATAARLTSLTKQLAEAGPAPAPEPNQDSHADAEFAVIDLVAAGLANTSYRAPDALNQLLCRVLRDFRVFTVSEGASVRWTATLIVPLLEGGEAEFALASPAPLTSTRRDSRRHDNLDTAALTPTVLSLLYMRDGRELQDIGRERTVRSDGATGSFLFRRTAAMLRDVLHIGPGLIAAAADMPGVLRPTLYRAVTAASPLDDPWEQLLREVYLGSDFFGPTWCMGHHREARNVISYLQAHAVDPFQGLPAAQIASAVGLPYALLMELSSSKRARVRTGPGYGRGPFLSKDFRSGASGNVSLLECQHKDCLSRITTGRGGVLMPHATPETTSTVGRPDEELLGVVCQSCRRLPGLRHTVLPAENLQPWIGGRRQRTSGPEGDRWVGSRLTT